MSLSAYSAWTQSLSCSISVGRICLNGILQGKMFRCSKGSSGYRTGSSYTQHRHIARYRYGCTADATSARSFPSGSAQDLSGRGSDKMELYEQNFQPEVLLRRHLADSENDAEDAARVGMQSGEAGDPFHDSDEVFACVSTHQGDSIVS